MADDITDKLAARLEQLERSMKQGGRQFGRAAGRSRDNLEREWDALKSDLGDLLDSESLSDRPEVRAALNKVRDSIHHISDAAYDAANEVQRKAREGASRVDDYAHTSPWQTAGMAAAAGLVIGFLLSRR
ncbi:MAG: DUF883 domain-containing protein [Lautropia sp.]|nr:DUF883 domain-containing protein [Lautropia sp.]